MTIGPQLLGRTLEHDPKSRNFAHPVKAVPLRNVTHTLAAPHLDQKNVGSCEGNTAAEFLNCAKALRNRQAFWRRTSFSQGKATYLDEVRAIALYSKATRLDNDQIPGAYPPTDTGTSGVGIAKAMQFFGAIGSYNWTFTWDAFLAALQTQAIMLGTNWYTSMFDDPARTVNGVINGSDIGSSAQPDGGHAYLAFAYRTTGLVGCTNHWVNDDGSPWGVRIGRYDGCFWIPTPKLQRLLIGEQGDSLVPVLM